MYSNSIPNFQESTTFLNACTENSENLLNVYKEEIKAGRVESGLKVLILNTRVFWGIKDWHYKVEGFKFVINPG